MADFPKPAVTTAPVTRQIIENTLGIKELRFVRSIENALVDVSSTLPDSTQQAGQAAYDAQTAAATAQATANAAATAAANAQTTANSAVAAASAAQATANSANTTANSALTLATAISTDYVSKAATGTQALASSLDAVSYKVSGLQVVGARVTGWTAYSGATNLGAFNSNTTYTVSATYTQSEVQAIATDLTAARKRIAALEQALRTHGLIDG